jgi:hypothetical protein
MFQAIRRCGGTFVPKNAFFQLYNPQTPLKEVDLESCNFCAVTGPAVAASHLVGTSDLQSHRSWPFSAFITILLPPQQSLDAICSLHDPQVFQPHS